MISQYEADHPLNESPSEKEGKFVSASSLEELEETLNESPSEKEGKYGTSLSVG